jgi:RimJ/RimL family protein N-acetyltransferase
VTAGPVIEGVGVTLRPWQGDDLAFVFHSCQDPLLHRFLPLPKPYRAMDAVGFFDLAAAERAAGIGEHLAITATDTGELLGAIGAKEIGPPGGSSELGYWLAREGRGRGAARAALAALASWCFVERALASVVCLVAETNAASLAVAQGAGFAEVERRGSAAKDGQELVDAVVLRLGAPIGPNVSD